MSETAKFTPGPLCSPMRWPADFPANHPRHERKEPLAMTISTILTDEHIEASLRAAHLHSTPESRKDMCRALETFCASLPPARLSAPPAGATAKGEADEAAKDSARLDWLDKNIFHREQTDEWDRRLHPNASMWVLFAPKGPQGTARNIIDAAMSQEPQQ